MSNSFLFNLNVDKTRTQVRNYLMDNNLKRYNLSLLYNFNDNQM